MPKKKQIWKTVKSGKYKGLRYRKKGKLLMGFKNPKGKLKSVAIVQRGDYTGFTAIYTKKPYRKVARGKSAEKLAARLAKKGHKSVSFWD